MAVNGVFNAVMEGELKCGKSFCCPSYLRHVLERCRFELVFWISLAQTPQTESLKKFDRPMGWIDDLRVIALLRPVGVSKRQLGKEEHDFTVSCVN